MHLKLYPSLVVLLLALMALIGGAAVTVAGAQSKPATPGNTLTISPLGAGTAGKGINGAAGTQAVGQIAGATQPAAPLTPLGSGFTYQGRLLQSGSPVNGQYDFAFSLYDAATGGNLVGSPSVITTTNQTVSDGLYTVVLDFGAGSMQGDARWLELAVRVAGSGNYNTLLPRQQITAAPYASSLMPGAVVNGSLGSPLLTASNSAGEGVYGLGVNGVHGDSLATNGNGVRGSANNGSSAAGVYGTSVSGFGVAGSSSGNIGVYGTSVSGFGVAGSSSGNVGVYGTSSANNGVGVRGVSTSYFGVYGESIGNSDGVHGLSDGNGNGVTGIGSGSGTGVYGISVGGTGVYGTSNANNGFGVQGVVSSTNAAVVGTNNGNGDGISGTSTNHSGVFGGSTSGTGVWASSTNGNGVYGSSSNSSASGVYGVNPATNGVGVKGTADNGSTAEGVFGTSSNGFGVYGLSASSSADAVVGNNIGGGDGVHGLSNSGVGVYGSSANSTGVQGVTGSFGGSGVWGQNNGGGDGVHGISTGNVNSIGVSGISDIGTGVHGVSSSGYAGYFNGNVYVTGHITAPGGCCTMGAGSTEIDDPNDPANKLLNQSLVESPDMKNVYDGNVTTDAKGEAVVVMPSYLEALDSDFRYQLTVIGQFAQAIVSSEIKDGKFTIETDKPNVKVSWQVTGIRKDPYAVKHPVVVEQDKPANEKGYYLYPDLYGQPATKSLDLNTRNQQSTPNPVVPVPGGK